MNCACAYSLTAEQNLLFLFSLSFYSSSYSIGTLLTKPCTFELRMLYYNKLLLHKIDKIKMTGTSRDISSVMTSAANNYDTLKEMLGIYQPYEYSWMFLSNSTKYIWELIKNIAAIVIHMVGIHIQAELIQANLGFR